jgi:uncharacterized protein YutD
MTLNNFKQKMTEKARKKGYIWENFGQNELRKLKDKYIDISDYSNEMNTKREKIQELDDWASHFNLDIIRQ